MKVAYYHFPIVTVVHNNGAVLKIMHYLGTRILIIINPILGENDCKTI